jgi:hypothetical protein
MKCREKCGHEANKYAMIGRRNQLMVAALDRLMSYKRGINSSTGQLKVHLGFCVSFEGLVTNN